MLTQGLRSGAAIDRLEYDNCHRSCESSSPATVASDPHGCASLRVGPKRSPNYRYMTRIAVEIAMHDSPLALPLPTDERHATPSQLFFKTHICMDLSNHCSDIQTAAAKDELVMMYSKAPSEDNLRRGPGAVQFASKVPQRFQDTQDRTWEVLHTIGDQCEDQLYCEILLGNSSVSMSFDS